EFVIVGIGIDVSRAVGSLPEDAIHSLHKRRNRLLPPAMANQEYGKSEGRDNMGMNHRRARSGRNLMLMRETLKRGWILLGRGIIDAKDEKEARKQFALLQKGLTVAKNEVAGKDRPEAEGASSPIFERRQP